MTETLLKIADGDVFRWIYSDPDRDLNYLSYWAKSRIAIAKNGVLSDTFWIGGDNSWWTYEDAQRLLILKHLGNLSHFEKADEWKRAYYAPTDYLDLNHSNSSKGNFYLMIGAQKNKTAMQEHARHSLIKAEQDMASAQRSVERYRHLLDEIENSENLDSIYI